LGAASHSLSGMSRYSVAKTYQVTLGVWGRLFGAPTVFLSLAKSVSFFLAECTLQVQQ